MLLCAAAVGLPAEPPRMLLEEAYPLEVAVPFHAALLHWLDSLAHLTPPFGTAGKTTPAHRRAFEQMFGAPAAGDESALLRYRDARMATDSDGLTAAFFRTATLGEALTAAEALLGEAGAADFRNSIEYFAPRYGKIWDGGAIPESFLARAAQDPQRKALAQFLLAVARFFGVDPARETAPCLVLVPVDAGFGTHAQAVGRFLLIEIRPGENLLDEVGPIVHENAHYLWDNIGRARRDALERTAVAAAPWGAQAWRLLQEALPTALAQGLATQRLRPARFSLDVPWYHVDPIDAYAKRIFPLVQKTLEGGGSFDEAFVREAVLLGQPG